MFLRRCFDCFFPPENNETSQTPLLEPPETELVAKTTAAARQAITTPAPPSAVAKTLRLKKIKNLYVKDGKEIWDVFDENTKTPYALKVYGLGQNNKAAKEYKFLQECAHPLIVKAFGLFAIDKSRCLLLEKADGDLFDFLMKHMPLEEKLIYDILKSILQALQFLHEKKIAHRDLKLDNILVFNKGGIKLTDLEMAKKIECLEPQSPKGTTRYVAPEVIKREPYDLTIDHWSLGVILYVLAYMEYPFDAQTNADVLKHIVSAPLKIPPGRSDELRDLIGKLLDRNYHSRLGCGPTCCQEILGHPWMKKNANWSY